MFKFADLLNALGHSISDSVVAKLFNGMGIDLQKDAYLESGLFTAHVERKNEGISFTFTDEAMFLGINTQPIGAGALYFSGVFFYAEGKDGYSLYKGELPDELDFSYSRPEIMQLLGQPAHQRLRDDHSVLGDRWDKEKYSLSVTYSKGAVRPVLVSLFIKY